MGVGKLKGFLPYKLLDPSRLVGERGQGGRRTLPAAEAQKLVGQKLRVKVTQVGGTLCWQ